MFCSSEEDVWQIAHTLRSQAGGGHREQLTVLPVVRSAVFWDSVPDLSVLGGRYFECWVFFPLNLVANVTSVKFLMESAAVQSE